MSYWMRLKHKFRPDDFPGMRKILVEFKPYKGKVALVIFLGLVISAIQPVAVKLVNRIVDELQKGPQLNPDFFRWVPFSLILIFLVSGLAKYFHNTFRRYITERVIIRLRTALFDKYLHLPLSVLDKKRTGELLAGIQNDLVQVSQGIDTLCVTLKEPFTFLGLIGVAVYCDWKLALSTLIVAPLVAYLFSRSGAAVKRYSKRNLAHFSDLISLGQESLTGARVVKVFRLERPLLQRFTDIHERYFKTVWKSIRVEELSTPSVEFVGALLIAGVIIYGGFQASQGALSTGQLVAFVVALGLAQMPIKQLNNAFLKLKTAEAAAERIFAILEIPGHETEKRGFRRMTSFDQEIRYDGVGLNYDDKWALRDVSFSVKRGDCVAFVGPSGSGKTSIVNLLPRLYELTEGSIRMDGVPISDILLSDLRSLVSFVTQDTFLFNDSIYENIRYGNPLVGQKEIEEAARLAHCADFISKLPSGLATRIGDRGVCLSGGERQRIAIARAFLKGAPILVLDEATSSLDSQSEAVVQSALEELMAGRTTFIVAHRLSTVRRANQIFVVDQGRVHEVGTHEELLGRKGIYSQLYSTQNSAVLS